MVGAEHLDLQAAELWARYERQEDAGLRRAALQTLVEFIDSFRAHGPEQQRAWVEAFCRAHWDDYGPLTEGWNRRRIRQPLVANVLLPLLLDSYRSGEPHYARWLGQFALSDVIRGAGLTPPDAVSPAIYDELRYLGMGEFRPPDLLREALQLDPCDKRAAYTLIAYLEETFDYWTHHVPDYVLTDDVATWRAEIEEFEHLVERFKPPRDYETELEFWRLHCDGWGDYRRRSGEFDSYAAYLVHRDN
jgi:hypothetical protein